MSKNLVIVESPAKVKTISKFLGKDFNVDASYGHVIDLPKSSLGVDIENDFEPKYITIRGKGDILQKLKNKAKTSDNIYLATDPDREGEAISWHLKNSLKVPSKTNVYRISFNEITKQAVTNAINNPRELDLNLVNSQQARRTLDRIVGYKISPILWEKIKGKLSAGRVQSVALKLICDREKEINAFVKKEYWTLVARIKLPNSVLDINFYGKDGKKLDINSQDELNVIKNEIGQNDFVVSDVKISKREKKPPLPFTTSSMQQEAGKLLNFPVAKTMRIAQKLYEGVDLPKLGQTSLITYLRTDSTRISEEAIASSKDYILREYGENYLNDQVNTKSNEQKVQDAHEAIRPTYIEIKPESIKESLSRDEFRLYQLIYKRFIASRMKSAVYDTVKVTFNANNYIFNVNSSKINFDGFLAVYKMDEEEENKKRLPEFKVGDRYKLVTYDEIQHFTEPPSHFTESSLVKVLEEEGIGRPSTYAPTISNILNRRYIVKEKKNLFVTELGIAVNDIMTTAFNDMVDVKFTANMEKQLDEVESGKMNWKDVLRNFYPDFEKKVEDAMANLSKIEIKEEISDEKCEKCGANLIVKYGPYGKFLACPNFPNCRFTKNYIERTGYLCPECKKHELIKLRTKKGRIFYACEDNENCKYMCWQIPKECDIIKKEGENNEKNL